MPLSRRFAMKRRLRRGNHDNTKLPLYQPPPTSVDLRLPRILLRNDSASDHIKSHTSEGTPLAKKSTPSAQPESYVGSGGELHQTGSESGRLTTNQGVPIADDQNVLTMGSMPNSTRR